MRTLLIFVIAPIFCNTFGELLLKYRLNHMHIDSLSTHLSWLQYLLAFFLDGSLAAYVAYTVSVMLGILFDPIVMLSVGTIFVGTVLWLVAMSKFELSFIYPFLSLNYVVIVLGSQFLLGESVSLLRYGSVLLIVIGLVFISRSPNFEK